MYILGIEQGNEGINKNKNIKNPSKTKSENNKQSTSTKITKENNKWMNDLNKCMNHPTDKIAFVTAVVEHWVDIDIVRTYV